jgi:two-component system, response regulator, stage 0 sporulation protein F
MKKIMIVDDEYLIRYSLASYFHDSHTETIPIATGEAALRAIRNCHLDLCFLDIHLPDMNGLDIMKMFRDISPWTRIILITGSIITDEMMTSIRENAHCLISKPFDLDQVKAAVSRVLTVGKPPHREDGIADGSEGSSIQWIADDYRKHLRNPTSRRITCYEVAPPSDKTEVPVTADVFDVSESGMGIMTTCKLQPGHLIRLSDAPVRGTAVVRWSVYSATPEIYRAGIQFVAPENIPHLVTSAGPLRSNDPAQGFQA